MAKAISENIDLADPISQDGSNEKTGGKIKTMVEAGRNQPGAEVLASPNTDNPVVPGNFHEFKGSQAKMYDTYEKRMSKIEAALGNKSPLVS